MALIADVWLSPPMIPRLCAITGCHRTTVSRWIEKRTLPPAVARLIALVMYGRLQWIHPAWDGWTLDFQSGELLTPAGWGFEAAELLAVPLRYQHIAALELQISELRDAHPRPGNRWPVRHGNQYDARFDAARRRLDRRPAHPRG